MGSSQVSLRSPSSYLKNGGSNDRCSLGAEDIVPHVGKQEACFTEKLFFSGGPTPFGANPKAGRFPSSFPEQSLQWGESIRSESINFRSVFKQGKRVSVVAGGCKWGRVERRDCFEAAFMIFCQRSILPCKRSAGSLTTDRSALSK